MERIGDGFYLRLQILVVEEILRACYIEYIGCKLVECMFKTFLGYFERSGYQLVAVFDGLLEELLVVSYHHQSVLRLILGVEQTDIHAVVAQLEVVLQYAIVEQQLYIVGLQLITVITRIYLMGFDIHVASRFLLHQQFAVGGHQVHTSLYAECFADERRLEDGFLPVVKTFATEG